MDEKTRREIDLHRRLVEEYRKRYGPAFARRYLQYWNRQILDPLPTDRDFAVLDLGCGSGVMQRELVARYERVVGLDPSYAMLREVRFAGTSLAGLVVGTGEDAPFKPESFDIVICRESLHHMADPARALRTIRGLLRENGVVAFSDPCDDSLLLRGLRKICFKFSDKFSADHGSFSAGGMERMLAGAGFVVERQKKVGFVGYPLCGLSDCFPLMRCLPFSEPLAGLLIRIDELLSGMPAVRRESWLVVTHARKV